MKQMEIPFEPNRPVRVRALTVGRYPIHWHDNAIEIVIPLRGEAVVTANFERVALAPGEFHIVNPRSIHSFRSKEAGGEALLALVQIDVRFFEERFPYLRHMFFRSEPYRDPYRKPQDRPANQPPDRFEEDRTRFRNRLIGTLLLALAPELAGAAAGQQADALVYSLVYEFNWIQLMFPDGVFADPEQRDRYHRIVRYIDEHYAEKITLDDVVAREYVTKTYFSHFWKKISSYSFTERVNYERVLKSEFLLLEGRSLQEISDACGFSDIKYYYRHFKRWYGCMPREHRSRCHAYEALGEDYVEAELLHFGALVNEYAGRFLRTETSAPDPVDDDFYIDKYQKIQLLEQIRPAAGAAPRYIILNPFRAGNRVVQADGEQTFNWHSIDLYVHLTLEPGYTLYVDLDLASLDKRETAAEAVDRFLEGSALRYGAPTLAKWHYFLNFKDVGQAAEADAVEAVLTARIKAPAVFHSFDF